MYVSYWQEKIGLQDTVSFTIKLALIKDRPFPNDENCIIIVHTDQFPLHEIERTYLFAQKEVVEKFLSYLDVFYNLYQSLIDDYKINKSRYEEMNNNTNNIECSPVRVKCVIIDTPHPTEHYTDYEGNDFCDDWA